MVATVAWEREHPCSRSQAGRPATMLRYARAAPPNRYAAVGPAGLSPPRGLIMMACAPPPRCREGDETTSARPARY
jgi:hypothetical protein